jgi:hypothetical protein
LTASTAPAASNTAWNNGGMENDYITVAREDNGRWFTARIDQIRSAPNPTLDIEEQ